jgi:hypothetical protein
MKPFIRNYWWLGSILSIPPWGIVVKPLGITAQIIFCTIQLFGLVFLITGAVLIFKELKKG